MIIIKSKAPEIDFDTVEKIKICAIPFVKTSEKMGSPFLFSFQKAGRNNPCFAA
jgi:hypothetical protein